MPLLRTMEPPKILVVIATFTLGLIFFQTIYTSAQSSYTVEESAGRVETTSEAMLALTAQLELASAQISKLEARLDLLENREKTLQNKYSELADEMTILRKLTGRAIASNADDRKKRKKIERVVRLTGGRPGQKDMVVSINKFSITWNQIEAILDKLDEVTQTLSRP